MKTIFFNVDTQKDFMNKDGKLYIEGAEEIKPNLKKLTEYALYNDIQTIFTADCHTPNSKELSDNPDFKTTFPPHCLMGSEGWTAIDEVDLAAEGTENETATWLDFSDDVDLEGDVVIYKDQFDVFADNDITEKILKIIEPDRVIVYGVVTEVCVHFAVMGLLERGYHVIVVEDAIKSLPNSNFNTNAWEFKNNEAVLMKTEEIIKDTLLA